MHVIYAPEKPFLFNPLRFGAQFFRWTKRWLVDELTAHFTDRTDSEKEGDRPAAEWLPGLLRFPAVKSVVQDQA